MRRVGPGRVDPVRRIQPDRKTGKPPVVEQQVVERDVAWFQNRFDAEAMATIARLQHKARWSVFDNLEYVDDPTSGDAVFSYTVPDPFILGIYRFGMWCSEPGIALIVRPRLAISEAGLTNIVDAADLFRTTNGDLAEPPNIDTIWVQAGETVALVLTDCPGSHYRVGTHAVGRMYGLANGGSLATEIV